jgi:DNA-binding response OmpR family regulator
MPAVQRVLVLEDEPLIAFMMRDWLTELGYQTVGPAHTVADALALIKNGTLDGAILDVSIGDKDSFPVADALRSKGIPFAFATGHAPDDGLTTSYGGALSLSKPYDFEAVRGILAKLLDTHVRS